MKIAIFHNLPSGGAKRAVYEWVCRLAGEHTIDVYSLNTADHAFCDIRPFVSKYQVYEFFPHKLFESPLGRLNQLQRWRDLGELERLHQKMAAQINLEGYDVLFANTCKYTFIPPVLKYVDIPSVYYLHEPFGPNFFRPIERPYDQQETRRREVINRFDPFIRLYGKRLASMQKQSVLQTSQLLANSQFTREYMQKEFGRDSEFIPYGVDLIGFQPVKNTQREDFVVSVGEMSARKGFDFIVKSLGKIPAGKRPALKLACNMVNQDELSFVNGLAENNQVNLEVLIGLGVKELRTLYNRARLCVYSPILEPFGLVPLEAMACGTPVVGVREGGVSESVVHEHTGLLVEREPERFAAAVESLLSNPDLAETYGRNAREHVLQNWNWDRSVSLLNKQLQSVRLN